MIAGIFHKGSGLGNQLHRYVATRALADDKGYLWAMRCGQNFKGYSFMDIGIVVEAPKNMKIFEEKVIRDANGVDIRGYDPEINFVMDNTLIDGEFQDPRYFEHRLDSVASWLKVDRLAVGDDTCIIGFRGGEFTLYPDLFLSFEYWSTAISIMRGRNPDMAFHVVTDDPEAAKLMFPTFTVTHEIGMDWRKVRFARYAIIANSSFYILPRLLAHHDKSNALTIAPRYWARRSAKQPVWALPQNYYQQFKYI